YHIGDLISHSRTMEPVFDLIPPLAASSSTVLIEGETGTGKELVAHAIHSSGARAAEPFVAVNCGALPDNLLESELFGYKKGAFTGAQQDKPGRLRSAGKGTIFLDEIGEISLAQQVKLLRVLQEHQFEPLGSTKPEPLEARIIAATHRSLAEMVEEGSFRQDLFYRIQVITLELPPLRDRTEDIPLLVQHFIQRFNQTQKRNIQGCLPDTMNLLMAHDWPGNVRELENIIEHAFVLCRTDMIEPAHLPATLRGSQPLTSTHNGAAGIRTQRDLSEKHAILAALEKHDYNRQAAARALGIHKTTLYRKIKALAIPLPSRNGRQRS
ncbi:MAG: sigma 54-interacting transcriptional regulator, partial [Desulfuromonas sp.]